MKKSIIFFALILCSLPSWATWTCAQGGAGCTVTTARTCSGAGVTSCNITVTSTHAHAVEVMCGYHGTTTATLNASSSDGTWTVAATSKATDTTGGMAECAYNLNATGAVTTINCPFSASGTIACTFFEFTGTGSSFTFDVGGAIDDSVACTSCASPTLTLGTANNYILIAGSSCGGSCSAINQSYTGVFITGDGGAFKINQTVFGTSPSWTMTSSTMAGSAIAIYEVTGGAAAPAGFNKKAKLDKLDSGN